MERLTYRTELGVSIDKNEDCPTCSICWNCDIPPRECKYISDVLKKLAEYEDLEEQGRLVILPCKMRDIIYVVIPGCKTVEECKVISVNYSNTATNGNVFYIEALPATGSRALIGFYSNKIGKTVFLTKSEAEAKLKELRGGENESSN